MSNQRLEFTRRKVALTIAVALSVMILILAVSCASLRLWSTVFILTGLVFDGSGALIIIGPEVSNLEQFWQNEETAKLVDNLKQGRDTLFETNYLEPSEDGFSQVSETILSHTDQSSTPNRIAIGGSLGAGTLVRLVYDEDNPSVGTPQIVEEWLSERIDRNTRKSGQRMITDGAKLLAVGFAFQIIGTAVQRVGLLQEILINTSPC